MRISEEVKIKYTVQSSLPGSEIWKDFSTFPAKKRQRAIDLRDRMNRSDNFEEEFRLVRTVTKCRKEIVP